MSVNAAATVSIEATVESNIVTSEAFRIFTGQLHRIQHRHGKILVDRPPPPPPPPEPVRRPARIAIMLALAHKLEDAIQRGIVRDRAEVARRLGFTRARVTQLMDLMLLAPDIQERILEAESVDGIEPMSERELRRVLRSLDWSEQRGKGSALQDSSILSGYSVASRRLV
ncbi:MAG: hypothetical protein V2A73_01210 [Pseudomonadota bacterium]